MSGVPRVSYSQQGEDVLLDRIFGDLPAGTYMAVGAAHPVTDSNSRWFFERGWRGTNIEPVAERHALFVTERPGDLNLCCAVGSPEQDGAEATLFVVVDLPALSTLDPAIAERHAAAGHNVEARRVPVRSLGSLVDEHSIPAPEFLSIDCEGSEAAALAGAPFANGWLPKVLVIESTAPMTLSPTFREWEHDLSPWYAFAATTGLNRLYLARGAFSEAEMAKLAYPPPARSTTSSVTIATGSSGSTTSWPGGWRICSRS